MLESSSVEIIHYLVIWTEFIIWVATVSHHQHASSDRWAISRQRFGDLRLIDVTNMTGSWPCRNFFIFLITELSLKITLKNCTHTAKFYKLKENHGDFFSSPETGSYCYSRKHSAHGASDNAYPQTYWNKFSLVWSISVVLSIFSDNSLIKKMKKFLHGQLPVMLTSISHRSLSLCLEIAYRSDDASCIRCDTVATQIIKSVQITR